MYLRPATTAATSRSSAFAPGRQAAHLVVVQVADVDDDDSDEEFERDAGDEQREDELVEAMTATSDVEQQLQLRDLGQGEDGEQRPLGLRLRLLQLAVTRQQLRQTR